MALALGLTVDELLTRVGSRELTEWMAYARLEPFGEPRADLRMGITAALIANCHRNPQHRAEPYTPEDFMPRLEADAEEREERRQQTLKEKALAIFGALRGMFQAKQEAARGDH